MNNKKLWPKLDTNDLGNSSRLLNSTKNLRSRWDTVAALLALRREKQTRKRMDVPPLEANTDAGSNQDAQSSRCMSEKGYASSAHGLLKSHRILVHTHAHTEPNKTPN